MTEWGDLDYLIIDTPPGTGDIAITLGQEINYTGAVIVTTPHYLSFIDVVKGIDMFDDLSVPTISVVENMAYFQPPNSLEKHYVFGKSKVGQLQKLYGIENSFAIPIIEEVSKYTDMGSPFVMTVPDDDPTALIYKEMAISLEKEAKWLKENTELPHTRYDTSKSTVIVRNPDGKEKHIQSATLRKSCKCAKCVDELSGAKVLNDRSISDDIFPHKIAPKGNYAVAINWSDGHFSLFPFKSIWSDSIKGEVVQGVEEIKKGNSCSSK